MRLKKEDIKDMRKVLKGINYFPVTGDSYIAIPIDMSEETKTVGDFTLQANASLQSKENGIPVIILWDDEEAPTVLGYVNPVAFVKFDLLQYADLVNSKLSKGDRKFLSDIDVFLINKNAVYGCFEFERRKRK